MSPVLKKNKWIAEVDETNWACGHGGGAAKAKHAAADGESNALDIMRGCNWGFAEYTLEDEWDIGASGIAPTATLVTGADYKNPAFVDRIAQTSKLLLACHQAAEATPGTIGANFMAASVQSWLLLGSNGLADIQSFGCVPLKYTLILEKDRPVLESCEFRHYDSATGAIALTAVPFIPLATSPALMTKACTISINGTTTYQVQKCAITIDFEYAEEDTDCAAYLRDTPVFIKAKFTWDLTIRDSTLAAVLDGDRKSSTIVETHDLILTLPFAAASKTYTLNNWKVMEMDDLDSDDAETKIYTIKLVPGISFTQEVA
jgi:hypothetical protein